MSFWKLQRFFCFVIPIVFCLLVGLGAELMAHDKVVIAGTGDSQKLLRLLGKEYCRTHPHVVIDVPESVGNSGGIKLLLEGRCEFARVARELTANELYYNFEYRHFAKSPIVFVVSANIKMVDNISPSQMLALYGGQITQWSELGPDFGKIYIANREKGDSSRSLIEKVFPAFTRIDPLSGKVLYTTQEVGRVLNSYDNIIAYLPLAAVPDKGVRVLKFAGVPANRSTVTSGSYPLVIPLGLVWHGELSLLAADFIAFVGSLAGAEIILDAGAYPVSGLVR